MRMENTIPRAETWSLLRCSAVRSDYVLWATHANRSDIGIFIEQKGIGSSLSEDLHTD